MSIGFQRLTRVVVGALLLASVIGSLPAGAATGPDVASWQHPNGAPIDWGQVRSAGHDFVFMKADEGPVAVGGAYYTNPYFRQDWNNAAASGLYRGAYHFARPKLPLSTAVDDARHFVSVTGSMQGSLDLPPVLDFEVTGGLAPADLAQWARNWLQEVERLSGRRPMIYTGYYFWRDSVGGPTDFGRYPLWIASWTNAAGPGPLPAGWTTWTFWQWTDVGSSPGIDWTVDLNRFCCPDASLALLAGHNDASFGNPFGSIDAANRTPSQITVSGWAIDPDTTAAVKVDVYVDDAFAGSTVADGARPDVASAYPGFGSAHGYSFATAAGPGAHTVCVYAINKGAGDANMLLGCRVVVSNPIGSLDSLTQLPGGAIRAEGWALDPDANGPIQVGLFVNASPWASATANGARPDVAAALSLSNDDHGYSIDLQDITSVANVCAIAINTGPGDDQVLGCRLVDGRRDPHGSFDAAEVGDNGVAIHGWAIDPDTTGPVAVHVYVDGKFDREATATSTRPDVGAAYPGWGSAHGFDVFLPDLWVADHDICVYALNVGAGSVNMLLGCRHVRPQGEPFGTVDAVVASGGGLHVAGWAVDPDTSAPIQVATYVDGAGTMTTADGSRPDVAAALSVGPRHGFDRQISTTPGTHQVCIWALNVGQGMSHRLLDCRNVTV